MPIPIRGWRKRRGPSRTPGITPQKRPFPQVIYVTQEEVRSVGKCGELRKTRAHAGQPQVTGVCALPYGHLERQHSNFDQENNLKYRLDQKVWEISNTPIDPKLFAKDKA